MKKAQETPEYWTCTIGPVNRSQVPHGGDYPLRQAVKQTFEEYFDTDYNCSSGWGLDTAMVNRLAAIRALPTTDSTGQVLAAIDKLLASMHSGKKSPLVETAKPVEWMFNFSNGGWNTVWAVTAEEAYSLASKEYHWEITKSSFRKVEENREDYESALRAFW
jgi:hypothetical protein